MVYHIYMKFLSRMSQFWLDFFFPKKRSVIELESLSTGELLNNLPPSPPTGSDNILVIFDYKHPLVRGMIWELKYGGNRQVAAKLGEILCDVLHEELSERFLFDNWGKPILIPVPISDKRRFERGWNQAELLCKTIMASDKKRTFQYLPRHLAKVWHTVSQTTTATKRERLSNIKNTMRVLHPPAVKGKCVVLVDDVTTTGATFAEAKRALTEAGAKKIICIAVAH